MSSEPGTPRSAARRRTLVGRVVSRGLFIVAGVWVTVGMVVTLVHLGDPVRVDAGLYLVIVGTLSASLGAVVVIATPSRVPAPDDLIHDLDDPGLTRPSQTRNPT